MPRYEDACGIARALDLVGDRWALLVVRELSYGGVRFAHLRAGLPGISPNVLSQRLRDLDSAGVVRRTILPPPADVTVYELTARGNALRPVLRELGRWGSAETVRSGTAMTTCGLLLALETMFDPQRAVNGITELRVDGAPFAVEVEDGVLAIRRGAARAPAVVIAADIESLRPFVFGRIALAEAERTGRLSIAGSRRAASRFGRMFPVRA